MENNLQQNQQQGLSVDHVKQLEEFLGTLMSNQEIIIAQNKEMLNANKMKQMWAIAKTVGFIIITILSFAYMPQIISGMTEEISSSMNLGGIINTKIPNGGKIDINQERIQELQKLLNK